MASMLTAETAAKNNNENMTLHELFMNGKQIYLQIENGQTNITAKECAIKFEICNRKIRQQGIFSNNERVDDVKTNDLKYLLSHAYLGKLYGEKVKVDMIVEGPAGRYKQIKRSILHYTAFLNQLNDYQMLLKNDQSFFIDMDADSRKETTENKRARKVSSYEEEKTLKLKLQEYEQMELTMLQKNNKKTDIAHPAIMNVLLDEEDEREKYLTMIQLNVKEALNNIDLSKRELEMLEQMRANLGDRFYGTKRNGEDPRIAKIKKEQENKKKERQLLQEYKNRPGLSLTHIMPDGTSRMEKLKSDVFKPSWNQPTMSLEEFADLELKDALAREERSKQAQADPNKVKTYKQLYDEGLEDDNDLVEKARKKDSDWNNWKDDHPKGSGVTKRI